MKKNNKNRFRYWFDNQMSAGTGALIRLLTLLALIIIVVVALILLATEGPSSPEGFWKGFWIGLNHMLDPGNLNGDEENSVAFVIGMVVLTFIGVFLTSTLTGIICNAIDEKVHELQRGKSIVVENNHIVVLGTSGGIYTIISEIIGANENQKKEALVIMDDRIPKDEMDERVRQRFPDTKTTRVICRYGNISDFNDLEMCSLDTCRSIIINAETDFQTIKCILAVVKLLKENNNKNAYLTAVIKDVQNVKAAEIAAEGYAEILNFKDVVSRIIAHTGRNAGLSVVYTDLFDNDGSEFYIEDHPGMAHKEMKDLNLYFPISTVVGVKDAKGNILINPEPDYTVQPGDELILFAEDDGVSKPSDAPAAFDQDAILPEIRKEDPVVSSLLILGYSEKLKSILSEEDAYVAPGSRLTIAIPVEQIEHLEELKTLTFRNMTPNVVVCDIYNHVELEKLLEDDMGVIVLVDSSEDITEEEAERKDEKVLMTLLQLKHLSDIKGMRISVTSEMLRVENQELAQITEVNDFVVSNNLMSLMLCQISQTRELKEIFDEILSEEGSEIYVRPARDYIKLDRPVNIYTAGMAASRHREVLIGYRKYDPKTGSATIVTNPPKADVVEWNEKDSFIVLAID